jgi:hypothetical protein
MLMLQCKLQTHIVNPDPDPDPVFVTDLGQMPHLLTCTHDELFFPLKRFYCTLLILDII